jgi:hypothetical protein
MTFSEILAAVYDECGYQSTPAPGVVTRVKRFVNEGVRTVLAEPGLQRLAESDTPYTFASVAAQARYILTEPVAQIRAVTDRTNDLALTAMTLTEYRRAEPDPVSSSGMPVCYVPMGRMAVAAQPSNSSQLLVKSTSASDTGAVYLETIEADGTIKSTTLANMTGTTAVNLGTTTTLEVTDFYIATAAVGTITLHEDTGSGTELARIGIGHTRPVQYHGLYLWPTPSAAITYYVDYRRELVDMTQNTDEPPLPTDWHHILSAYAEMREWEQKQDGDRLVMAKVRFDRLLSRLKYETGTGPDELPVAGRGRWRGHSRLGAYFPADTWTRG